MNINYEILTPDKIYMKGDRICISIEALDLAENIAHYSPDEQKLLYQDTCYMAHKEKAAHFIPEIKLFFEYVKRMHKQIEKMEVER